MKKALLLFTALFSLSVAEKTLAQTTPFPTIAHIDINKINAASMVHGDMWWDPTTQTPQCEFPKGSGKNISFTSSIWMSGYDNGNNLHVAAQTYRQDGNDYWPGPLDNNDTITWTQSQDWARIWKINKTDITSFLATTNHTTANTPAVILEWPAKGNIYAKGNNGASLNITEDMAPFVDVDADGIYNPLIGDYPDIKGDQALWWVFNDNGPAHTESNGTPLKAEIHCMAYAYSNGTLLDNIVYYDYKITNKSDSDYHDYRIGQFADMDLGYSFDDYIAFDSTHRMGIVYNGHTTDGNGQPNAYGNSIPIAGISMIILPGDTGSTQTDGGSFMYYNNDFSVRGNPSHAADYNNYLRATWLDGTHVKNNCTGYGSGTNTNYVFTGDPSDSSAMSECKCGNMPGDRRFIITSNSFTLPAGGTREVVMALVTTDPDTANACPDASFTKIKEVADTAWKIFESNGPTNVPSVSSGTLGLTIYPNPVHDKLYIPTDGNGGDAAVTIYNSIGQTIYAPIDRQTNKIEINTVNLPNGAYHILYINDEIRRSGTFIKN